MIFFDYLRRHAGQCAIDARAIHDAGFLDEIHVRGYYHSHKEAQNRHSHKKAPKRQNVF
jgi:hypothetical protein